MNHEEPRNSGSTVFTSLVTTLASATPSKKVSLVSDGRKRKRKKPDEELRADILQQLESCWKVTGAGCWEWTGPKKYKQPFGSVQRWQKRSGFTTSRAAVCMYESKHGKLGKGQRVYLTCKNDLCVRPEHLQAVTLSQRAQLARMDKPGAWPL